MPLALMMVLSAITRRDGSRAPIAISDAVLVRGVAIELALGLTVGLWLWWRGWRPLRTATRPFAPRDLARGMALWIGAILAVSVWALVCKALLPGLFRVAEHTQILGAPSFWGALGFSLFNAVFEELLWLGLGFAAFRRFGPAVAGTVSASLRLLAHAYQGPLALVTVLPVGVVFTVYYARSKRMWPVVVAHAFQDVLALSLLAAGVSEMKNPASAAGRPAPVAPQLSSYRAAHPLSRRVARER